MASPAPKSPEQTEKNRKYDRQLRLWGDHGQSALESAQVCVINATALGTEILKALVLPGIGAFTIVDGNKVTMDEIGSNFFLEADSCGKSRAQIATQLLLELNSAVRGDYVEENVEQLLENSPDFFNNFTVVVATALPEKVMLTLSKKLWLLDIPFLVCRSYGFIGYLRVQISEHTVIETHPDNQNPDLRLDVPFPSLRKHVDSIDLDSMEYKDHSHVPYLVILYKYLEKFRYENDGAYPKSYKDKERLREMIRAGILQNEDGVPEAEENFEEAIKAVNATVTVTGIPSSVKKILDDDCCVGLTSRSKPFWVMAKAVRDFVENEGEGRLPLRGVVPDMTAKTDSYVALLQIYHQQAARDAEAVFRRVQQLLHELSQPADTVSEADVRLFCKHASSLHLERGSAIADEYDFKSVNFQNIVLGLEQAESPMVYYVMLRGVDRFFAEHNTFPGELADLVEPDIAELKTLVCRLLAEWGAGPLAKDDYVHEMCRYGAAEVHSVSAFMGGCVAQEVIKFITRQYVPVNNTFMYDAIMSTTATFEF